MTRPISFEQAKAAYVHRFTMDHRPVWAYKPLEEKDNFIIYPAPHYRSDKDWYDNTYFPGEAGISKRSKFCQTRNQTWPIGKFITVEK
jgi:hypothetical protein